MSSTHTYGLSQLRRSTQRGVSLVFALMGLVVLSLGAVALLRSVDTGLLVLGNLGFKQDSLAAGSVGTEQAITWLQANAGSTLEADQRASGYSASAVSALDPTGRSISTAATSLVLADWDGNACTVAGIAGRPVVCVPTSPEIDAGSGNMVRFVITRLCNKAGPVDSSNDCLSPVSVSSSGKSAARGSVDTTTTRTGPLAGSIYYRILTQTKGVRGTVSYTESLIHF